MAKRFLTIIIVLTIAFSALSVSIIAVDDDAVALSGVCGENGGDNLKWTLTYGGVLTISGSGKMQNWASNGNGSMWYKNPNIKTIIIEPGATTIGNYAFYYCTEVTSISIPDTVTSIKTGALNRCESLESISIPSSVTTIEPYAFGYSGLTSIQIPDSVTTLGTSVFSGCSKLVSASLPSGIKSLEYMLFGNCSSLESIIIPENVTAIGDYAFYNCASLRTIEIPKNVTSIGKNAFSGCSDVLVMGDEGSYAQTFAESHDNLHFYSVFDKMFDHIIGDEPLEVEKLKDCDFYGGDGVVDIRDYNYKYAVSNGLMG